jgi:hypothetical protein
MFCLDRGSATNTAQALLYSTSAPNLEWRKVMMQMPLPCEFLDVKDESAHTDAEEMLREIAYVLQLTRSIRAEMDAASSPA